MKRHNKTKKKKGSPRRRYLSLFEEFILTIVRVRRGFGTEEMSFLMGITEPHVSMIFLTWINTLYNESISDREIVIKSGFLKLIEPKDNIMGDRCFNIIDLLLRRNAFLKIPLFSD